MQDIQRDGKQPFAAQDPQSQPLSNIPLSQDEDEDDPERIFLQAVAEIETQPLLLPKRKGNFFWLNVSEVLCWLCIVGSVIGMIYQLITYPHTFVILYTRAKPTQITVTLDLPTRAFAPVTLTRSATTPATGTGHQDARVAAGQVTFYNGLSAVQSVPAGTKLTGSDGIQIRTDQTATIPPNAPPEDGNVTVSAHALHAGAAGNIQAFDVAIALSSSLTAKNLAAFTGGRDARTYRAVAPQDLTAVTTAANTAVTQAFRNAFPLRPGQQAIPTNCHETASVNHHRGEEAQTVTLTMLKTCSAVAYNSQQLNHVATAAFTKTRPGAPYHVVGSVQTSLLNVTPLTVTLRGKWAYAFSQDYQDFLAQEIQGDSPSQARSYLLQTGVISYASVPATLPSATYINFVVLVE